MRKVLFIFSDLTDADVDWLAAVGKRKAFPTGSVLIEEGNPIDEVYVLLEGELSVRVKARGDDPIAILHQGEIVGELSFLDSRPPLATVAALTDSVVLAIPRDQLSTKLDRDPSFAAHFYRALGVFLATRLRNTMAGVGYGTSDSLEADEQSVDEIDPELLESISLAAKRFEVLLNRFSD